MSSFLTPLHGPLDLITGGSNITKPASKKIETQDNYRTLTRPWPPFTAYHHAFQGLNEV